MGSQLERSTSAPEKKSTYGQNSQRCRWRGSISEARTKQQAEQAESKIKQEIFEKRLEVEEKGTGLLSDFLEDDVYLPWSEVNKKSWRDDAYNIPMLKAYFEVSERLSALAWPRPHAMLRDPNSWAT